MGTFKEAKKMDKTFKCDQCKKTFKPNEVILTEAADNIKILTPPMPFIYVDKEGMIMGGRLQASKEKGDRLFSCPHCKAPHIFGFDEV